jgi:hypothetical protein
VTAPGRRAWDRQADETDKAWHAFNVHLRTGPGRTLAGTAEALGKAPGYREHLKRWSARYDWRMRAAVYDEWLEARVHERYADDVAEMNQNHVRLAKAAQALVARTLQHYSERDTARLSELRRRQREGEPISDQLLRPSLQPNELARLMDTAVKVERQAAGLSAQPTGELEQLSDDELLAIVGAEADQLER